MPGSGYGSGNTSTLDVITRTCKNAGGTVIAIQRIAIQVRFITHEDGAGRSLSTPDGQSANRFKRTGAPKLTTEIVYTTSGSRTISSIETTGKFDTKTESGSDITEVTYLGDGTVNDLVIPVNTLAGVLKVGGTA